MRQSIDDVPIVQHPSHRELSELFDHDKMATFLVENKAEVCSLLIGCLLDRVKEEGFTEADLIRGMAAHCRNKGFPEKVELNLLEAALRMNS
ncbi:MAG: hypothetical protein J7647_32535 [Cyanobacteria bacterium SBLK]|nr:hypothetical protein [Cyanobacteria bacterium SBLK]